MAQLEAQWKARKKAELKPHIKAKLLADMYETGSLSETDEVLNAAGVPIAGEAEAGAQAAGSEQIGGPSSVAVAPIAEEADQAGAQGTGSEQIGGASSVAVAPIAEEAEGGAQATESEQIGGVCSVAVASITEEAEGGAQATGSEHFGGSSGVSVAPIANQGVESQQVKSGQTEKGKTVVADSENKNFPVRTRVTCSKVLPNTKEVYHRTALVVTSRNTKDGVEYYVRYDGYDNRFNEWLLCTFVEKCSDEDTALTVKSPAITPTRPADRSGSDTTGTPKPRRSTRKKLNAQFDETTKSTKKSSEKEHEEEIKPKNFKDVWLGKHAIDTWYFSPYPEEYHHRLYMCEFCLKYMKKKKTLYRHKVKCMSKNPPGVEIYKTTAPIAEQVRESEGTVLESTRPTSGTRNINSESVQHLSVYEVDGSSKNKLYCQNLCLLAGLFLDDENLYYNVDTFLFYILTENDASGKHLVAYFSKEKDSENNISCILTLPPFQRKQYGSFLIAFAYELSTIEGKVGTPERPLSALGKASFNRYWERVLVETIRKHRNATFEPYDSMIQELTKWTSIRYEDVISTLQNLKLVKYIKCALEPDFPKTKREVDVLLEKINPLPDWLKIDKGKIRRLPVSSLTPKKARNPRP